MEITVTQADLKDALDIVKRGSSSKGYLPATSSVLLDATEGLSLRCTDFELFIEKKIGAVVKEKGQALIPVGLLSEFVGSLPQDKVTISVDKQKAKVKCGRSDANIRCLDPGDFPAPPKVEPSLTVDAGVFKKAIGRVAFAAATDDARPVLSGILLDGKCAVTADGFRLAKADLLLDGVNVLVPARTLKEALRALNGTISIGVNQNMMVLSDGSTQIGARLIEGQFPPIDRIMPDGSGVQIVVEIVPLLAALRSATIFARDNSNIVRLSAEGTSLMVSSISAEQGDSIVTLDAETTADTKFALNVKYLVEILSVLDTEKARFFVTTATSPVLIHLVGDDTCQQVLMPMNLNR